MTTHRLHGLEPGWCGYCRSFTRTWYVTDGHAHCGCLTVAETPAVAKSGRRVARMPIPEAETALPCVGRGKADAVVRPKKRGKTVSSAQTKRRRNVSNNIRAKRGTK